MIDSRYVKDKVTGETLSPSTLLARVLQITQEMLESANRGDWENVTDLEDDRRELLAQCFASPVPDDQSQIFSEGLAVMLNLNEELIHLLEFAKAEVAIKRTDQQHARKSVGCYLDIDDC